MGNICVIGPRGSGKTTYLAAIAYLQNHRRPSAIGQTLKIKPQNPESRELAEKAENILLQGLDFEPTRIGKEYNLVTVDDLPFYSFGIESKKNWLSKPEIIQLTARDYPGEVFEKIAEPKLSDSIHEEFINECLIKDVVGCLILLTGWQKETDQFYSKVMNRFIDLMDIHDRAKDLKLAIAMSKCERGEIWSGRLDPEVDLFGIHLAKTQLILRERIPQTNIKFFAISTFGVLARNDPRPNREDRVIKGEPSSVIRDVSRWQPYNLIEPLYWLSKPQNSKQKSSQK